MTEPAPIEIEQPSGALLLDRGAVVVSRAARGGFAWMALAAWIAWRRGDPRLLGRTLVATTGADLVAVTASHVIGRKRPCERGRPTLVPCPDSPSLPSNHAASAAAAATVISLAVPPAAAPLVAAAGAVAWSRVRAGVHYPSDVVAGAGLGAAIALVAAKPELVRR